MGKKNYLLIHGEGIGNIIQICPLLATLRRAKIGVDIAISHTTYPLPKGLFRGFQFWPSVKKGPKEKCASYTGKLETIWAHLNEGVQPSAVKALKCCNNTANQMMHVSQSEVQTYLKIAAELGVSSTKYVYDVRDILGYDTSVDEHFDVVIADGYNYKHKAKKWKMKSYPNYEEVARRLERAGYTVCSIGSDNEYVNRTTRRTGLPLLQSLSLVRNASVVLANDTGMYHAASAFRVPTYVMFTCTSPLKNYDPLYHKSAHVLRLNLPCQETCQRQLKWQKCQQPSCRQYSAKKVFGKIVKELEHAK